MTYLLDNNVLLALVSENHVHHESAKAWLKTVLPSHSFATCPLTQLGFLRISCQTHARSLTEAQKQLALFLDHPRHVFWSADLGARGLTGAPSQLTDAYLVSLAKERSVNSFFQFFQSRW